MTPKYSERMKQTASSLRWLGFKITFLAYDGVNGVKNEDDEAGQLRQTMKQCPVRFGQIPCGSLGILLLEGTVSSNAVHWKELPLHRPDSCGRLPRDLASAFGRICTVQKYCSV